MTPDEKAAKWLTAGFTGMVNLLHEIAYAGVILDKGVEIQLRENITKLENVFGQFAVNRIKSEVH